MTKATTDYQIFKNVLGNRKIKPAHVETLASHMDRKILQR